MFLLVTATKIKMNKNYIDTKRKKLVQNNKKTTPKLLKLENFNKK